MIFDYSQYRMADIQGNLTWFGVRPLDVMVTGVTGAGKSTTLNAFFRKEVAVVGDGVDPETMELDAYWLNDSFRLWDTPGLGDGVQQDKVHQKRLVDLLHRTYHYYGQDYGYIDMVLVIIEGSNRDMGTTYKLLNEILVPNIQKERILVAINQADIAMKGRHWNREINLPDETLLAYLEDQAVSIQRRVREATGVSLLKPVYYSGKYGYHVKELFDFIIDNMPKERRPLML